jgi:hypothetical protein
MSLWGDCKKCHQPLSDADHIYGNGYCQSCDIEMAVQTLTNLKEEIEKDLEEN